MRIYRFKIHAAVERLCEVIVSRLVDNSSLHIIPVGHTPLSWISTPSPPPAGHTPYTWNSTLRCTVLPSLHTARRCSSFLMNRTDQRTHTVLGIVSVGVEDVHAVVYLGDACTIAKAKAYWQHTGKFRMTILCYSIYYDVPYTALFTTLYC
jgi:hypothetical protein